LLPTQRFEHVNAPIKRIILKLLAPTAKASAKLFPKQGNQFGFAIFKTAMLLIGLKIRTEKSASHVETRLVRPAYLQAAKRLLLT
jgi:hypothetical protein